MIDLRHTTGPKVGPVERSPDLERILDLTRRKSITPEDLADVTAALRTECGTMVLRIAQACALLEAVEQGGLLAPIKVGGGKSLLSFLLPTVFEGECHRPILLIPAALRDRTYIQLEEMRKHWEITIPHVLAYQTLAHPDHAEDLAEYNPDLIVADEVHALRHLTSATTRRVWRHMEAHPTTVFCGMSGTLQGAKLSTYAHLAAWALGRKSPLPLDKEVTKIWDQALRPDRGAATVDCGVLRTEFGVEPAKGLGAWIRDTPGFVATEAVGCAASIEISRWDAPKVCQDEIKELRDEQVRPDGTPLTPAEEVDVWCQLALGFWYEWDPAPPEHWMNARRDWCRFVRDVLSDPANDISNPDAPDSEAQVMRMHPEEAADWLGVKSEFKLNNRAVWIDRAVVTAAAEWAKSTDGIVWSRYKAIGEVIDLPHYGVEGRNRFGDHVEKAVGPISASIKSCGVGMNLQNYSENLLLTPTPNAEILEQLIGRTHRDGQPADVINFRWIRSIEYHTTALRRARDGAADLRESNQEEQKLTLATYP
jgi:hypothetical protein